MDILWIIGNGFDINLGLKTDYKSFQETCLSKELPQKVRRRLQELSENENCKKLFKGGYWSDLEMLVGESAAHFNGDIQAFHECFESVISLFTKYIGEQQGVFDGLALQSDDIEEFRNSVLNPTRGATEQDLRRITACSNVVSTHTFNCINLNYTSTFDTLLRSCRDAANHLHSRKYDSRTCYDCLGSILHLHGSLTDRHIVFGISDERQWSDSAFSQDIDVRDLWIKEFRNEYYGNTRTEKMKELIGCSDQICIYGASLGKTDNYIWSEVANWVCSDSGRQLILFVNNYPVKVEDNLSKCKSAERRTCNKLQSALGLDDDDFEKVRERVLILPSKTVFNLRLGDYETDE